jgi:hypothetical protein
VDYRLLERFRAKHAINAPQPAEQERPAAAAATPRPAAIDLRD